MICTHSKRSRAVVLKVSLQLPSSITWELERTCILGPIPDLLNPKLEVLWAVLMDIQFSGLLKMSGEKKKVGCFGAFGKILHRVEVFHVKEAA